MSERTPGGDDPLRRRARAAPGAAAVEWAGGRWSYGELDAAAHRVAGTLRPILGAGGASGGNAGEDGAPSPRPPGVGRNATTVGARRPPVVAAFLPPRPEAVAAIHGVPRAGGALAPLHGGWTAGELGDVLARLEPVALLAAGDAAETETARTALAGRRLEARVLDLTRAAVEGRPPPRARGATRAIHTVLSTSGSTGRPRLVALTAANHVASARGAIDRLALRPGDRWLASLPFAHVGGLALAIRAAVAGSALVLRGRFDAETWTEAFEEMAITHVSLVPTMLRRILARRGDRGAPGGLACVLLGGAATGPALLTEALDRGWPVALTYGLTETASQVATAPPERVRRKPGTVGPPLPGTALRIEEGEIRVRGPTVMAGYWDEPARNLSDGWLRTGDLGRLDAEGDLWVAGRRSARIVSGGVNVDPAEVEAVIAAHPGVRDAVVVGIPDPEWGERVVAAVEVPERHGPDDRLLEALEAHCRARLAGPKRPKAFRLLVRLPRTPTGKPDREAVQRRLEEGGA